MEIGDIFLHDFYIQINWNYHFVLDLIMGSFIAIFLMNNHFAIKRTFLPLAAGLLISSLLIIYYSYQIYFMLSEFNQEDLLFEQITEKLPILLRTLLEGLIITIFFYMFKVYKEDSASKETNS